MSEKYIELQEEVSEEDIPQISVKKLKRNKENKIKQNNKINLPKYEFGIVRSLFWGLFLLCALMVVCFIFF